MPSILVLSTLYKLWTGKKPNLNNLKPWDSVGFVQDSFHKYRKLGPREKKCIFIRYIDHFKGYVVIDEQYDGTVYEILLQDVNFIENEFLIRSEVDRILKLQEAVDQEEVTPSTLDENDGISQTPRNSESDLAPSRNIPLVSYPQHLQPCRSSH